MLNYKYGEQCDHGQLKRSCELCELLDEIENLKCCGNCRGWDRVMPYCASPQKVDGYCANWQSDGLTRKEREG
jgi:hypothetical protein